MSRFIFTIVSILLLFGGVTAGTIKVPENYATIQAGIDAAAKGDTVLVSEDTYYENINFKGKAITVASYFYVDGDTNFINNTIINGSRPSDPNKGSVVSFTSGEDTTSVICGFTITGGTGTIYASDHRIGGGIYCLNSGARISHNKIIHNSITHNQTCNGGGIGTWPRDKEYPVIIENNLIASNSINAGNDANGAGIRITHGRIIYNKIHSNSVHAQSGMALGGGISASCEQIPTRTLVKIIDNIVTNNQAVADQYMYSGYGGGIDAFYCNIELVRNIITHNVISGPEFLLGGGIRLWGLKDVGLVKDNIISFNSAINGQICNGGGMTAVHSGCFVIRGNRFEGNEAKTRGGGLAIGHNIGCVISDNEFIVNIAYNGGGLSQGDETQLTVTNNLLLQNTALHSGGGIYSLASDMLFINNIVTENEAYRGGGAYFEDILYNVPPRARTINNTFTANVADSAGGIGMFNYKVISINNICWENDAPFAPEILVKGGDFGVAYSDIKGGLTDIVTEEDGVVNWLAGNIDVNPLFLFSQYQLSNSSRCIGAGIEMIQIEGNDYECPNSDIEGNLRPNPPGSMPDIGAYENPLDAPIGPILVPEQYATIQGGINAAKDGDMVLIGDGTYYENINFKGKSITVASYFLMDGDTTHVNNTIIDGSKPNHPDSGSVVFFISDEDTTSVICGFTITGGTGSLYDSESRVGGGVYCKYSGARISHNKIIGNAVTHIKGCHGGGIGYWPPINSDARYVIIEDNVIESNSITSSNGESPLNGGGVYIVKGRVTLNTIRFNSVAGQPGFAGGGGITAVCQNTATRTLVVITGNTITHNQAITPGVSGGWGGGVDVVNCNAQILGNTISHNKAGGIQGPCGAGIRLLRSKEISLIKENIISYNSITTQGWTAGIELVQTEGVQVIGNIIEGNNGPVTAGGGIDETGTSGNLIKGNFIKSNIGGQGGGIWAVNSTVINNIFVENVADWGGGIFCYYESSFTSNLTQIINNTITKNVAKTAGGIAISKANTVVLNTICWGNTAPHGPEIQMWGGILNAANSDIRFGSNGIAIDSTATVNWLATNIDADPLFADTLFHLSDSSPCIGKGIASFDFGGGMICNCPPTDYDGNSRPNPIDEYVDMGALESSYKFISDTTGIEAMTNFIPTKFSLEQNYPNPFNPSTTIEFTLPTSAFVTLKVYNLLGEEVATLAAEKRSAGIHRINWDAKGLASGVYLYRLEAGDFVQTKKLILMK